MTESEELFQPVTKFDFGINRAERTQQVRYLAPLLAAPEGRVWLLNALQCSCTAEEARHAQVYHLAFPLRDLFTADFHKCRGTPQAELAFIRYYNQLFDLREDYGADTIWRTHPGGPIRHPAAPGRSGWHKEFLSQYVSSNEVNRLMRIRQLLNTETDSVVFLPRHIVVIECKYLSGVDHKQSERQMEMGMLLQARLKRAFHFGLVVREERDVSTARIQAAYVTWKDLQTWLSGHSQPAANLGG